MQIQMQFQSQIQMQFQTHMEIQMQIQIQKSCPNKSKLKNQLFAWETFQFWCISKMTRTEKSYIHQHVSSFVLIHISIYLK